MEISGLFVYTNNMSKFFKILNTSWENQPLELLVSELISYSEKTLPLLYPLVQEKKPVLQEGDDKESVWYEYIFGGINNIRCSFHLQKMNNLMNRALNNNSINYFTDIVIESSISVSRYSQDNPSRVRLEKDSRFFYELIKNPYFIFTILLEELKNYISYFYFYKGMSRKALYSSKIHSKKVISDFEVVLLNNFSISIMEPLLFHIISSVTINKEYAGGYAMCSFLEFILLLLGQSFLEEMSFKLPHFACMFFTDNSPDTYNVWISQIRKYKGYY